MSRARFPFDMDNLYIKQEYVNNTRITHPHYHFLCSVDHEIGFKTQIWLRNLKDHIIRNKCTSTSSQTTLTKHLNLNRDRQRNGQCRDTQTKKHNAPKGGIKTPFPYTFQIMLSIN